MKPFAEKNKILFSNGTLQHIEISERCDKRSGLCRKLRNLTYIEDFGALMKSVQDNLTYQNFLGHLIDNKN